MTQPRRRRLVKISLVVVALVLAATGSRIIDAVSRLFEKPPANIIIVAPEDSQTV
jgi:hypothetical protein